MRKILIISSCIIGFLTPNIHAQEVKMKSIPYSMHFENVPLDYKIIADDHVRITASEKTDLFISPDGGSVADLAPRLVFKPDSDFILTSKIELEFKAKWDAGVLVVYNDSRHYAKFCFESDYTGQPRVVTVVCNETCDDCNSVAIDKNAVYYKIVGSTKKKCFLFL